MTGSLPGGHMRSSHCLLVGRHSIAPSDCQGRANHSWSKRLCRVCIDFWESAFPNSRLCSRTHTVTTGRVIHSRRERIPMDKLAEMEWRKRCDVRLKTRYSSPAKPRTLVAITELCTEPLPVGSAQLLKS